MTKKLFAVFSLILFVATVTNGQFKEIPKSGGLARLMSMGNNPYVIDPYFITTNPAWASNYGDFLWGDLGTTATPFGNNGTSEFAAFNFNVVENLVLGGILSRSDFANPLSISSLQAINSLVGNAQFQAALPAGSLTPIALNNNIEAFGAFDVGMLSIGLGVSYAHSTNQSNPATGGSTESTASQIGFNAGVVTNTTLLKLDASAAVLLPSVTATVPNVPDTKASQTYIQAQARLFYKMSTKFRLIPSASFLTSSGTMDVNNKSYDLPSQTLLIVGLGLGWEMDGLLIAGGPSFAYNSTTTKGTNGVTDLTNSTTYFPIWNLGAEFNFTDWFIGRIGYWATSQSVTNQTIAADPTKFNETVATAYNPGTVTVGVGFRIGSLSIDGTVNVDVLRQGLANLGNSGAGPTFGWLSMGYGF
jgi:hypothetical protein